MRPRDRRKGTVRSLRAVAACLALAFFSAPDYAPGLRLTELSFTRSTTTASKVFSWLRRGAEELTLEAADAMASAALAEARTRKFNDISVFVVDAAGRVLVSKTMLGCPRLIPSLAEAKAGAAIGTHCSSRALKEKYVPERTPQLLAMTAIANANNQPFCAVPGGVLVRDKSGNVVGAIGVSGASADEDEHCAITGARAVGLVTEPAESALK
eukprot:CAMPEP_0115093474 /NCGR_PEP_ID=MMETSP0227-20121206/27591_1 /TAXON_ID=89957 /ORGANISM="Polarella glacialis, Strain CCMP 1383" /LENGTH=211 /DNA_ID=CAMNT_0002485907 /DNA_START=73 /DNA_END=708 /DNA_ORIENTATION=+